jgi:hypothetical protein
MTNGEQINRPALHTHVFKGENRKRVKHLSELILDFSLAKG